MEKKRCTWPGANELMIKYHDEEWGVAVHSDNKLFEFIVLDSFQAGLSWSTILNKRENFREAFDNFDYKKIANYDENKISKLLQNAGIIRNKLKIRATITNAQNFIKIQTEFGSFNKYIWQFVNHRTIQNKCKKNKDIPVSTPESDAMSKDLKKRGFKFVGTTICYAFMQAAGMVNDHLVNCFRYEELSKKTAPYIDNLILSSQNYHEVEHKLIIEKLLSVFSRMCCIEKQGDDEYRSIWITVERGKMEDYGDYKEAIESGEVDDKDNFEQLWKAYYPDEIKWYSFAVSKYEDTYYFYFDSKLTFQFKADSTNEQAYDFQSEISDWLLQIIDDNISRIEHNITEYNKYIDANLPYKKRTGRILRSDFWTIFPEFKEDFNKSISPQMIEILHKVKAQSETMSFKHLSEINSEDFFRYCEIGYDANKYFKKVKEVLTPKEKYKAMADGRDCGLKDIGNSYEEFVKWYKAAMNSGAHPWEICRGGNSTHISLFIHKDENGWYLILAGSSRVRVIETVLMAVALYKQKIPFVLRDATEIYNMVNGTDYIGIVPEWVTPRYCHSFFPAKDNIIDFMNLEEEKSEETINKAFWYPLEQIDLVKS